MAHHHDHDHDSDGRCVPQRSHRSINTYEDHGIKFRYPADWELSEHAEADELTISVQSDGTSFWTIVLLKSSPDPEDVLESVVSTFEQDYEDLDVVTQIGSVCGLPAMGRDLDFSCYDLLNTAVLRSFQIPGSTVLVMYQGTDHELTSTRDQMEAITASLECDDDDDVDAESADTF